MKTIFVPLASGYYDKAQSLAKKYNAEVDTRNLKPNQKIESIKNKHIVCIGNQWILDNKVITPAQLELFFDSLIEKKKRVRKTKVDAE